MQSVTAMTIFDYVVLGIVGISVLLSMFARGHTG